MSEPIADNKNSAQVPFGYQFISDRDPGDESDSVITEAEVTARSGTRTEPAKFPAGF